MKSFLPVKYEDGLEICFSQNTFIQLLPYSKQCFQGNILYGLGPLSYSVTKMNNNESDKKLGRKGIE